MEATETEMSGPAQDLPHLEDLRLERGDTVLVRADLNVPMDAGEIVDDLRIRAALPTISHLRDRGAAVVVAAHLGRPGGRVVDDHSLRPVAARLGKYLDTEVALAAHPVDEDTARRARDLAPGEVLLLENIRFDEGEEHADEDLVRRLVALAEHYVNDAFGTAHREHASVVGPPAHLPSAAGQLLRREVDVLTRLRSDPDRPLVAVVGGAKLGDKIDVIRALVDHCDRVCIGGGLPFTFLEAEGRETGDAIVDPDLTDTCRDLLHHHGDALVLPSDFRIRGRTQTEAELEPVAADEIPPTASALDIGPATIETFAAEIAGAATVFWAGPMGVFEAEDFAEGTRRIALAVADSPAFSIVGGGETTAAVHVFSDPDRFDHLSTGGGAALRFIEHGDLPGLAALRTGESTGS